LSEKQGHISDKKYLLTDMQSIENKLLNRVHEVVRVPTSPKLAFLIGKQIRPDSGVAGRLRADGGTVFSDTAGL
jgi:hypothetical protein